MNFEQALRIAGLMPREIVADQIYNRTTSNEVGIGLLVESAEKSATVESCGFLISGDPFLAIQTGSRKASQLPHRGFTGRPTCLDCRPDWSLSGSLQTTEPPEAAMAQIPNTSGNSSTDKPILTQSRLKELLNYDPETGEFTWKAGKRRGRVCESPDKDGYLRVQIDEKTLKLHRLAFLYMTGSLPVFQVDHIDGCTSNNKWVNLRDVCASTNQQNRRRADITSNVPLLGVARSNGRTKFSAQIRISGRTIYLGNFETEIEAHNAYLIKKRALHIGCTL